MPEIFGIQFEYPQILTLEYIKAHGILWNDDHFSFESYWEGSFNHYERLFYQHSGHEAEPFTGLVYELYPDGSLHGYSYYVSGYQENVDAEFYPNGQIRSYTNFQKSECRALVLKWFENGQLKEITQLTNHSRNQKTVEYDEQGNIIGQYEK